MVLFGVLAGGGGGGGGGGGRREIWLILRKVWTLRRTEPYFSTYI